MSHFTVLVVGDDPEAQLAPYHEFECTGTDDKYVLDIDNTDKVRKEFEKHRNGESFVQWAEDWYGRKCIRESHAPNLTETHKFGYIVVDADGNLIKSIDRTNPNAKWDWYKLGGRWRGYFRMKEATVARVGEPGTFELLNMETRNLQGKADQARKGDIDFAGMRREASRKAGEQWDKAHAIINGRSFKSWDSVREAHGINVEAARSEYNAQDVVQDFKKCDDFGIFDGPEAYSIPRERHCASAANGAASTFAVVKDGHWYEKGSMGWWGCVSDAKHEDAWHDEFAKLIDDLPDDTLLSVYDCHI